MNEASAVRCRKNDYNQSSDQRRKGYIGEGGSKPGKYGKTTNVASIGFAVSASPMPSSLVTFLHGGKKVTLAAV